jgi:hypothetical protein
MKEEQNRLMGRLGLSSRASVNAETAAVQAVVYRRQMPRADEWLRLAL